MEIHFTEAMSAHHIPMLDPTPPIGFFSILRLTSRAENGLMTGFPGLCPEK
jgi:hypothetical protein